MGLLDEQLTYDIRACFFEVHNEVGVGLFERPYHQALGMAFAQRGISARSKDPVNVSYRNHPIQQLQPDFIVGDKVVLELKAVRAGFAQAHFVQLFSYLKATRLHVGFLVNFGRERVQDERIVFHEKPVLIEEDFKATSSLITGQEEYVMNAACEVIHRIATEHGLGYGENLYRELFTAAMSIDFGLSVMGCPYVRPVFRQVQLSVSQVDCFIVGERIVVLILSLREGLASFDLLRCQSFLRNLRLRFGVVANFGKDRLQMQGVTV